MNPSCPPEPAAPAPSCPPPQPPSGPWSMRCQVRKNRLRLRLRDGNGRTILRARLPLRCPDPTALAGLCEALASYSGRRLGAVVSADAGSLASFESVFTDCHAGLCRTAAVALQFDLPGYGLSPSLGGPLDRQMALDFDAEEF